MEYPPLPDVAEAKVEAVRLEAGDDSRVMRGVGRFLKELGAAEATDVAASTQNVGLNELSDGNVGADKGREFANRPTPVDDIDIASFTRSCVRLISSCIANLESAMTLNIIYKNTVNV